LHYLHLERKLALKDVEPTVIRAQAMPAVLFWNREHCALEVPVRFPQKLPLQMLLHLQTIVIL
jgi:hypothetical protein